MRPLIRPLVAALLVALLAACRAPGGGPGEPVAASPPIAPLPAALAQRLAAPRPPGPLHGLDGWLFHEDEAAYLLVDRIAARPADGSADPLAEVLRFRDQLRRSGRELIVVPVPAKLAIYPEELLDLRVEPAGARIDRAAAAFFELLRARDVRVVDLTPAFLAARRPDPDPLYPRANSHWSSRGALLAARVVADEVRAVLEAAAPRPLPALAEAWSDEEGDLGRRSSLATGEARVPPDRVLLRQVPAAAALAPVPDDGRGPVLLLGDSNLLFLTNRRSGFPHLLGRELGFATPQIAVNAGGPTGARQKLARLPHRLAGKRVVVWVFASRQLAAGPAWKPVELPPLPPLPVQ